MEAGDKIHHIDFGYGIVEFVLNGRECLAFFAEYERRDMEPTYRRMEELYGRPFERIPNKGLQLVQIRGLHNLTKTGIS